MRLIRPRASVVRFGLFMCAALSAAPAAARADGAAGQAAFDRHDYVLAYNEWHSAAERGDPIAEFGLGMLYERGDGGLTQDYKQADRWYQKAAEHGIPWAEYRLSLIWAAGSDAFQPDLVEAYKWIALAAEGHVALALEAQALLQQVLTGGQQAEGAKRATSWKQALAAKPPEPAPAPSAEPAAPTAPASTGTPPAGPARPAVTTPPVAAPPVQPGGAAKGGCPGWPFPTLPCTMQFPSLGGGAAPRPAAPATPPAARQ